ncbi:MAG: retroviral-like aspartic protease family protein, partial [Proteobacteria bacterium]|nr:retroviral-like aspartic protease family protein [Pseudomonadota bacterium]
METSSSVRKKSKTAKIYEIDLEDPSGAEVTIQISGKGNIALVDTGASCSCMSEESYNLHGSPPLKTLCNINVKSASGNSLQPMGMANCNVSLGGKEYTQPFIVCRKLTRNVILGRDFLRNHRLHVGWSKEGRFQVHSRKEVVVGAITVEENPIVTMKRNIVVPAKTLVVAEMQATIPDMKNGTYFDFSPTDRYSNSGINLVLIPVAYHTAVPGKQILLQILINFEDTEIKLTEGTTMGHLLNVQELARSIAPGTVQESICEMNVDQDVGSFLDEVMHDAGKEESKFIASPADVETHREVKLQDADVSEEDRQSFEELCTEFQDVFSKSSTDLGRTPLLTMDIDTGDHPPITQRPYSLALKHVEWVREEIEKLEQAGVITRSMSPWASPIVIVPKKTSPGEPPRRRMCVDYRMVNSLAPPVVKAHSKAKGILTFVPLPKIDEIFAQLQGSKVYSTFDMRSGYYHLELSKEAQAKTAFVIGGPVGGKWEFKVCPFGLTQAPAYFQRLVQQVLEGLNFAFGYLDDILIFSSSIQEHLKHVRVLFERLRIANLKLTARKCSFLKRHVQYLGHLISGEGIEPVPEKLKDLKDMAPPKTQKEVRRFLGFTGYYRKFIPRFSDIARPLTNLTKKDVDFEWTKQCQDTFEMMKEMLLKEPILKYPDPNYGYILYTDASKYAWAGVLTQEYHYTEGDKTKVIHHPITYVSGLFRGPQINWAALTKEAYAIYMSARKLTHYFRDSKILLRSDHLPLKKFLLRNTKNDMVNNWAMELQQFAIEFEYIEGIKNTLADTMSRLVHITPEIEKEPELPDQEFGKYVFEKLDPVLVEAVFSSESDTKETDISTKDMSEPIPKDLSVEWPITLDQLRKLQIKDPFCKKTIKRVMTDAKDKKMSYPYYISQGVLNRYVQDGKQRFETRVVPQACADNLLRLAHDDLGHNGSARTYMLLRRSYYWKGMKPQVYKYVKRCSKCQQCNAQVVRYQQGQFSVPKAPMDFISMDLIGEFRPPMSEGYKYALTVICMLTGFT